MWPVLKYSCKPFNDKAGLLNLIDMIRSFKNGHPPKAFKHVVDCEDRHHETNQA